MFRDPILNIFAKKKKNFMLVPFFEECSKNTWNHNAQNHRSNSTNCNVQ